MSAANAGDGTGMGLTPGAVCDDIAAGGVSAMRRRRCDSIDEWGGQLMPAFFVRLNGVTTPPKGEFNKAWEGPFRAEDDPRQHGLGGTAPLTPFGLFNG
jgi:hypothetical protein